jgi:hypothetical protein
VREANHLAAGGDANANPNGMRIQIQVRTKHRPAALSQELSNVQDCDTGKMDARAREHETRTCEGMSHCTLWAALSGGEGGNSCSPAPRPCPDLSGSRRGSR